jgi:hypothetical protein
MATDFISSSAFITQNTTGTTATASGALNQSGAPYSVIVSLTSVVGKDDGGTVTTVSRPVTPSKYSMKRVVEKRRRLSNQIVNTLRGM